MPYIYALRDCGESNPFYVGSTKHSLANRLEAHLYNAKSGKYCNRYLINKINKVGAENVCIELLEEVSASNRFMREYEIIQRYIDDGVQLVNMVTATRDFEQTIQRCDYELAVTEFHIETCLRYQEGRHTPPDSEAAGLLSDLIAKLSHELIYNRTYGFLQTAYDVFVTTYSENEADEKLVDVYNRVMSILSSNRLGHFGHL